MCDDATVEDMYQLGCDWLSWRKVGPHALVLEVPGIQCTDMTGAIIAGQLLMPHVTEIVVNNSEGVDTIYRHEGSKWVAYDRDGHCDRDAGCSSPYLAEAMEAKVEWLRHAMIVKEEA